MGSPGGGGLVNGVSVLVGVPHTRPTYTGHLNMSFIGHIHPRHSGYVSLFFTSITIVLYAIDIA